VSSTLLIKNYCTAPHRFRVTSKFKSLRFDGPADSVLITAGSSKLIAAWFNAGGLNARVYRGKVDVKCLDCREERGCTQDYGEVTIEMNVIKSPRPAGPAREGASANPNDFDRLIRRVRYDCQKN